MVSHAKLIETMKSTLKPIYTEIDLLISLLKANGGAKLATILEHRMYQVSWTSSIELLEEISSILVDYKKKCATGLDERSTEKLDSVIKKIEPLICD
jgi:hypothetical protein